MLMASAHAQMQSSGDHVEVITIPGMKPFTREHKPKGSYTIEIDPAGDWTDTKIELLPGDKLALSAEGTLRFADGRAVTGSGVQRGWKDLLRSFPVDSANVGALVGRIGDNAAAVPFVIGEQSDLTVSQPGNLFVRMNVSGDLRPTGTLTLHVKLTPAPKATTAGMAPSDMAKSISSMPVDDLPRRVTDEEGRPGDVVNFALLGTEQQVADAFTRSGWLAVDANVDEALLHGALSTLEHKPYVAMPMSKLYLFGRPQDRSYARAEALKVAAFRHHLRVWNTGQVLNGQPLWVGSATYDNGLERDQRNGNLTHSIDPEIDGERRFLLDSFVNSGSVSSAAYVTPSNPVKEAHTATGGSFHTDGRVLILALK